MKNWYDIYSSVEKPSRYTGGEYNSIIKDPDAVSARICLAFPEVYELGMSYIGFKILYGCVNRFSEYAAERAFMCWPDMGAKLLENSIPLASIETSTPVKNFDAVGFTLQYELSYTNILAMLRLGGIPILSKNRSDWDPIILAGGPNAVNPAPIEPFFDAFVIGDGEEIIISIMEILASHRKKPRAEKLRSLASLKGVYVPEVHTGEKIVQNIVKDLDASFYPDTQIVPFLQCVHDRAVVEVMRGCPHGCRFCQAGFLYRPVRKRNAETVKKLTKSLIDNTGYEDISFSSLSIGNYPHLEEIVSYVMNDCRHKMVSVSLPSLRVNSTTLPVFKDIQNVRRTGITIAPEAGSERLRQAVNKNITEEEILSTVEMIAKEGWQRIKLYFMIGLPTETYDDIDEMVELVKKIDQSGRQPRPLNINVSLSTFVPKPHTPFQWTAMKDQDYVDGAIKRICSKLKRRNITVSWNDYDESLLECILTRGDQRIAQVIHEAFLNGCTYDGWGEYRNFPLWREMFEKAGISIEEYTSEIPVENKLPWDFIQLGAGRKFLEREYKRAAESLSSPGCSEGCVQCEGCSYVS